MQRAAKFLLAVVLTITSISGSADDAKKEVASLVGVWTVQGVAIQGIGQGATLTIERERDNALEGVLTLSSFGGMGFGIKIAGQRDVAGGLKISGSAPTLLSNNAVNEIARFSFRGKRTGLKITGASDVVIESSSYRLGRGTLRQPAQRTVFEKSAELTSRYFDDLEKQKKIEEEQRQAQQLAQEIITKIIAVMNAFQAAISEGDFAKASELTADIDCGGGYIVCGPYHWTREAAKGSSYAGSGTARMILSTHVPEILGIRQPSPTEVEWTLNVKGREYRMVSVDTKVGELRFAYVNDNWKITNQWW